uniref:EGF-like domain-containing protein n=1 Tax=Strongyloides papillosus TaxID=174720 RepID=A0A0N5B746_STREA
MKFKGKNLCDFNPCLNEGVCQWPIVNESYFGCKCQPCYSGIFCEKRDCINEEENIVYNEKFPEIRTISHYLAIATLWSLFFIACITTLRFISRVGKLKRDENEGTVIDCTSYVAHEDSMCSSFYGATHGETRKRMNKVKNAVHKEHTFKGFPPLKDTKTEK